MGTLYFRPVVSTFFLSFFFFPRLNLAVADLDIYRTSTRDVA